MEPDPHQTSEPTLPQSQALAEAHPNSLADLFSRDPETLSDAELAKIVQAEREQRLRHEAAKTLAGVEKEAKASRAKPSKAPASTESAPRGSLDDIRKLFGGKIGGG